MKIQYYIVKTIAFLINLLPLNFRVNLFSKLIYFITLFIPRLKKTALVNLSIAFPEQSDVQRELVYQQSLKSLGRLLTDVLRLGNLDKAWIKENVEFPDLEKFLEHRARHTDSGCIYLTGHFGSFELLTLCVSVYAKPMHFIARPIKPAGLNYWWNENRTKTGNVLIQRKGAFKEVLNSLQQGNDVGILFDQNVVRGQAIFVDWFGKPAATTFAVAAAALKYKCPIFIFSVQALPNGKYRVNFIDHDYTAIYNNDSLSEKAKMLRITEQAASDFESLIRLSPAEWFWFHRRWKTGVVANEGEELYDYL